MSYELTPDARAAVVAAAKAADKGVERVSARLGFDSMGEASMFVDVWTNEHLRINTVSKKLGRRLGDIKSAIRDAAAKAGIPLFVFISMDHAPRRRHRAA